jgi:hypothetical protein
MTSPIEACTPRPHGGPSDEVLIQGFVDDFLQGNSAFLSNQNLRTEALFNTMQLLSAKEGVVATAKGRETPIKMVVRSSSSYWEFLHHCLTTQSFYPLLKAPQENCYIYRFCEPPEGYQLYCTTARELWRACWGRGFGVRSGIPLDLLVWRQGPAETKETWYSLRGMDCENGQLMVKMLGWTETISSTDLIVWSKTDPDSTPVNVGSRVKPGLQGYIRFRQ